MNLPQTQSDNQAPRRRVTMAVQEHEPHQADARRLAHLEGVIERGLETFVEVGRALMEIRDQRLYRETHKTFEAYCRERWGWGRNYANKQITAAEVAKELGTTVPNEAVGRELAPLLDKPERMREVWKEAVLANGPTPTAAEVRAIATSNPMRVKPCTQTPAGRALSLLGDTIDNATMLVVDSSWHLYEKMQTLEIPPEIDTGESVRQIDAVLSWLQKVRDRLVRRAG